MGFTTFDFWLAGLSDKAFLEQYIILLERSLTTPHDAFESKGCLGNRQEGQEIKKGLMAEDGVIDLAGACSPSHSPVSKMSARGSTQRRQLITGVSHPNFVRI